MKEYILKLLNGQYLLCFIGLKRQRIDISIDVDTVDTDDSVSYQIKNSGIIYHFLVWPNQKVTL